MSAARVRVLVLGPTPPPYHGVATFTRDLLHANAPDIELHHLDTSDRRDLSNLGQWDAGNLVLGFSNLAELAARCKGSGIHIVYIPISQNVPAFLRDGLFALQARGLGCQVVLHLHGGYFRTLYESDAGVLVKAFMRRVLNACSAIVVLADEFRELFAGLVPQEKVFVVENGVPDPGAFELHAPNPTPTMLFMSTLTEGKGIFRLLEAFALLLRDEPQARLRIAGTWADEMQRSRGMEILERAQLNSSVEFVGNVSGAEKAAFLASGNVFCLPTTYLYEGQPLVILEALAAGLPVVATRHAAIASTVSDAGVLVAPDASTDQLAAALSSVLKQEAKVAGLRQRARERYLARYTLAHCHKRLFSVFQAVTASRTP